MGQNYTGGSDGAGKAMMPFRAIQPLVYHRVCPDELYMPSEYAVRVSDFRRQMEYMLARGYTPVTLEEFQRSLSCRDTTGGKRVLVTFDDGYRDNYTHAFPVLQDLRIPAVIFLVADLSRRTNWWDQPLGVPPAELMRPEEIREMAVAGIAFGSHTLSHVSLPGLAPDVLRRELGESKERISGITNAPVRSFSYPYGHVDQTVRTAVRGAGYSCAFAVNGGPFWPATDPWEVRRVNVTASGRGLLMSSKLCGFERAGLWAWWKVRRRSGRSVHNEIRRGF
jgi:peptidoglycan/xylan/chitin deacetylase (PgdA/CDA1 family)